MSQALKPDIQLSGMEGNVFGIIGKANRIIKKWNRENQEREEVLIDQMKFEEEATSGDYDHVIKTVMKNFNVH